MDVIFKLIQTKNRKKKHIYQNSKMKIETWFVRTCRKGPKGRSRGRGQRPWSEQDLKKVSDPSGCRVQTEEKVGSSGLFIPRIWPLEKLVLPSNDHEISKMKFVMSTDRNWFLFILIAAWQLLAWAVGNKATQVDVPVRVEKKFVRKYLLLDSRSNF